MKVVAYLRVSTDDQAVKGVSLHAQRAKVHDYAKALDHELVAVIEDPGLSGKSLDRPGLRQALAMLQSGEAEALLVLKLDRLTRSVRDLADLIERHFSAGRSTLISMGEMIDTSTAGGRLVLNVLASVGQWEREAIAERTATALRYKKARGERVGGLPYGFRVGADGKALQPVEAEQATIARARELRAGGLSLRDVARELAASGHASRCGRAFIAKQIQRMLVA